MKKIKSLFVLSALLIFGLCIFAGCAGSTGTEDDFYEEDEIPVLPEPENLGTLTVSQAIAKINTLEAGHYAIKISGAITAEDITAIQEAMYTNMKRLIALDLSETTGLTVLPDWAFTDEEKYDKEDEGGTPLTSIILPNSIAEIGICAFRGCKNLRTIIAPGVTILRWYAITECKVLSNFQFADVMELIEESALGWNDALKKITLNAKHLGERMVPGCEKLTKIIIGPAVEEMDDGVFVDCCKVKTFEVANGNTHFKSIQGLLYTADGSELIRYPPALEKTEFSLPDEVTVIDNWSFSYCKIGKVSMPNIKNIPEYAFFASELLTEVSIPVVEEIGNSAFEYCPSLSKIQLPNSLKTIKCEAFSRSDELKNIYIPSSVETMGPYVFSDWKSDQTINFQCREDSIPEGWDSNWNKDRFTKEIIPAKINYGVNPQ